LDFEPKEEIWICDKCGKPYGILKEETIEKMGGYCKCEE